jgi:hypothetical protein
VWDMGRGKKQPLFEKAASTCEFWGERQVTVTSVSSQRNTEDKKPRC